MAKTIKYPLVLKPRDLRIIEKTLNPKLPPNVQFMSEKSKFDFTKFSYEYVYAVVSLYPVLNPAKIAIAIIGISHSIFSLYT